MWVHWWSDSHRHFCVIKRVSYRATVPPTLGIDASLLGTATRLNQTLNLLWRVQAHHLYVCNHRFCVLFGHHCFHSRRHPAVLGYAIRIHQTLRDLWHVEVHYLNEVTYIIPVKGGISGKLHGQPLRCRAKRGKKGLYALHRIGQQRSDRGVTGQATIIHGEHL
jgi:hypothetical protein